MSRNPGIGATAKSFTQSWRTTAVWQGKEIPVPRYFHAAWQAIASDAQKKLLTREQITQHIKTMKTDDYTRERIQAAETIAKAKTSLYKNGRTL